MKYDNKNNRCYVGKNELEKIILLTELLNSFITSDDIGTFNESLICIIKELSSIFNNVKKELK